MKTRREFLKKIGLGFLVVPAMKMPPVETDTEITNKHSEWADRVRNAPVGPTYKQWEIIDEPLIVDDKYTRGFHKIVLNYKIPRIIIAPRGYVKGRALIIPVSLGSSKGISDEIFIIDPWIALEWKIHKVEGDMIHWKYDEECYSLDYLNGKEFTDE